MTYPNGYLYLTAHFVVAGTSEVGQFGLKFDSTAAATQALVDGCATAVQNMWAAATVDIGQFHRLSFLRLAAIGTDGKYIPGSVSYDHTYAGTVPGGGVAAALFPLQCAHVMTLRTAMPRGQAHVGRIYLPPIQENLGSAFTWTTTQINNRINTVTQMIANLNAVMPGPATIFSKGTKAAPTVGAKHVITQVNSDNKPDVQRRRARQQPALTGIPGNV
jgi:hypothetical protein